jgi:hypothetical protein
LIDRSCCGAQYGGCLRANLFSSAETREKTMTTFQLKQADSYQRHGSIAVMPAVCLWVNNVV